MNVTDTLLSAENQNAIAQLSKQLGITEDDTRHVVAELAPSLSRGMQHHTEKEAGLGAVLDALASGKHSRYLDQPEMLTQPETKDDGNAILGHIFGTKEVSRNVATKASESTGIATTLIKKALPIVATMVMSSLSKSVLGGGNNNNTQSSGGLLTSLLDSDRDGSMIDDVLGMAFKMAFR